MKEKKEFPVPPARQELSDTPLKFCNEISRLFRHRMREMENSEGIMTQPGAHLVLSVLAACEGINQLELVKQTHLRPPTVSVILRKMEEEGLVERRSNPNDLRSVQVYLTDAGRELDRKSIVGIQKLDAVAMQSLTEEEIELLMKLLPKIRDSLLQGNDHREEQK